MFDRIKISLLALLVTASFAVAEDAPWRVSKSSGDASVTTLTGEPTPLVTGATLNPGDNIRTGQTGRVLLVRGQETMLISPNSMVGIPAEKHSGLATTITQQAGSILLEVERQNVQHFSVETPYLAAVVKGTQFRVTVEEGKSRVDVLRGQVEVTDFKSGQYALVQPGQAAQAFPAGHAGLSLSGSGALNPIQQGVPRSASVQPVQLSSLAPSVKASPVPAAAAMNAPPARVAMAPVIVQPPRSWSSANSSSERGWTSMFSSSGSGSGNTGTRRNPQQDVMLAIAISCAVGFVVSLGVGAQRRRKSRKVVKG